MTDEEIVELYWQRSEEAEECTSETYLSAWNQMPSDRPARLLPYLGRIDTGSSLCLPAFPRHGQELSWK